MTENVPRGWGDDPLSGFIELARRNTFASYSRLHVLYKLLSDIDKAYKTLTDNLINTPDWYAAWFLLGTHSSYLGGARLSLSGQTTEAFRVLRGCIENALYGFHVSRNHESFRTWLNRHNNEVSMRAVKNEFRITCLFDELESIDKKLHRISKDLYDRTIDFGAHPNERAFSSNMKILEGTETVKMELRYMT
ncbi:MAG: hypothetical protein C4539_14345, partial [Ignavibacteriales bacterium]